MSCQDTIARLNKTVAEKEEKLKKNGPAWSAAPKSLAMSFGDAIDRLNKAAAGNEEKRKISFPKSTVHAPGSSCRDTIARLNQAEAENDEKLKTNPYSKTYAIQTFEKQAVDYGRPTSGSKTEARGIKAGDHVCREILYLCELIHRNAEGEDPNKWIKFGKLFEIYSHYSDKLVGMLIRARKCGLLHFEGEMLYQRQDDHKDITMLYSLDDIIERMRPSGDPKRCVQMLGPPPVLPPHIQASKEAEEYADEQRKAWGRAGWEAISESKGAPTRQDRKSYLPNAMPPAPPDFCLGFGKKAD